MARVMLGAMPTDEYKDGPRQQIDSGVSRGPLYASLLEALESIPWSRAPEVLPLRPMERNALDFFPGHRGYAGSKFPVGGIMIVGNNFSTTKGWQKFRASPDRESSIPTWRRLRKIIESSGLPLERFWFTNYCHGALDREAESYEFPARIVKALELDRVFERCVETMRPVLVVSLGRTAARHLRTDFALRERVDERTINGHSTKLMATVHPGAWTWQRRGFTDEDFREEGRRIGKAAHS